MYHSLLAVAIINGIMTDILCVSAGYGVFYCSDTGEGSFPWWLQEDIRT